MFFFPAVVCVADTKCILDVDFEDAAVEKEETHNSGEAPNLKYNRMSVFMIDVIISIMSDPINSQCSAQG